MLGKLKISHKLLITIIVPAIGFALVLWLTTSVLYNTMMQDRIDKTKNLVEAKHSIVEHYYKKAKSGEMSEVAAKQAAKDSIKYARYDGSNYFWINDYDAKMVMHGVNPALDGKDMSQTKDPDGFKLFAEFVKKVKADKEGEVHYKWEKPGFREPVGKVSYIKGFEPWGWIIGSGVYVDDVEAAFWEQFIKIASLMGVIILATAGFMFFVYKNIVPPMQRLTTAMQAMSNGDFTAEANVTSEDEIGEMAKTLEVFRANAKERDAAMKAQEEAAKKLQIADRVGDGIDSINHSIKDIVSGNTNLSERTEAQAANVEETTASVQQVSAQMHETSGNAETALKNVEDASSSAKTGTEVVAEAINAMEQITTSSEKISDIIAVIDEIAFQTNLLALNAAVEAARAGEQGRGFAVVASEVRALAGRSADAAKEIKDLITESVGNVKSGSEYVSSTGECLNDIVTKFELARESVMSIVQAVREQGMQVNEINKAIMQVDEFTQQNAALVEESTAASRQIEEQLYQLSQLVDQARDA